MLLNYYLFLFKLIFFTQITRFVTCLEIFSNDPDIDRNSSELIECRGFRSQTHYVITKDGYILTLFRIINPKINKNKVKIYPIYLQYGILGNTDQWLISRSSALLSNGSYAEQNGIVNNCSSFDSVAQTLPYVLSACGYDVWLGNIRGTEYSSHILFNRDTDEKYWAFNLDDYSRYDLTANIQYILSATQSETIGYIGFSLGNTIMFQLLSSQTEYSQKLKPFIALAPFVFLGNIRSPLVRLTQIFEPLLSLIPFRIGGFLKLQPLFGRYFCGNSLLKRFCILLYFLVGGFDIGNLDQSSYPRLWAKFPDSISSIVGAHVGQRIQSRKFSFYNYGIDTNLRIYGQKETPNYNISKIDSNYIVLMSGMNDFLSDPTDDAIVRSQLLVQLYADYVVPDPHWTHGDFLYATSVGKYINAPILRILESLKVN